MNASRVMGVAALLFAVGMGIGALGSHALQNVLTAQQLHALETAVNYQLFNALGLLLVGGLMRDASAARLRVVAWALIVGVLCFSGGIYLMLAGAPRPLGFVTPVGGVLLIAAWLMFAWQMLIVRRD
jgi:uncharacterized membrane protein YgdD (TMEM256/DUF423 family)